MGVPYSQVIDKLRNILDTAKDSEVAKALKITPQALSNFKKKDDIPSDLLVRFALDNRKSLDWLLGIEGVREPDGICAEKPAEVFSNLDPATKEALKDIQSLDLPGRFRIAADIKDWITGLRKKDDSNGGNSGK